MDKEKHKVPNLRFKGFTDDWEQRKLGDIGSLKNGMNFSKDEMGIGFPFVNLQDIFGKSIVTKHSLGKAQASASQLRNYNLLKGDVLFVRSSVKLEGVGQAAVVPSDFINTTYSGFLIRFRDQNNLDDNFKSQIFKTRNIRTQIMSKATDSANKNISQPSLSKLKIVFPNKMEQEKIGKLFKDLDKTITLHQRKLDLLQQLKKGLLQKMFADKDQKQPGLRFEGFNDAWEQRKLGEVAESGIGGGTPKTSVEEYWGGTLPWIQSSDLIEDKLFNVNVKKHITKLGIKNSAAKLVPENSIAVVTRVGVGKLAFMPFEYATSQDFLSLSGIKGNPQFVTYTLQLAVKRLAHQLQGTSIKGVTKSELMKESIKVPLKKAEQDKISSFLFKMDSLIALHQRKLDRLNNLKKGLLQQMFI